MEENGGMTTSPTRHTGRGDLGQSAKGGFL